MEMIEKQPGLLEKEPIQRKPQFPRKLFEEAKFIDPKKEAELILPQQELSSALETAEIAANAYAQIKEEQKEGVLSMLYYRILSLLSAVRASLRARGRRKARLTRKGQAALEQLKYLACLCEATSWRTHEEVLAAESAFGEAYYEIMSLSSNLQKMSQEEQEHHIRRYCRHIGRLLRADE
ncbi:MAG: hypothetical protein N3F07_03915 [Candidatus Micrarchaeota archaeon]|nr:hypothetical protein [Candidatus Micrarchaeota archaeon]